MILADTGFWVALANARDLPRIGELVLKYAKLSRDLADASLVILAEHVGTGRILSTGTRDFGAHRWKNRKPFAKSARARSLSGLHCSCSGAEQFRRL